MYKKFTGVLFLALMHLLVSPVAPLNHFDDAYESWTAQEKSNAIWERVMATEGKNSWWLTPWKVLSTFFVNFDDVFERTDFVQYSWWSLWLFPRWKSLHTVGTVQRVEWVPEAD